VAEGVERKTLVLSSKVSPERVGFILLARLLSDSAFHGFETKLNLSVGPAFLNFGVFSFTALGESERQQLLDADVPRNCEL
jgi:hypothetical protein